MENQPKKRKYYTRNQKINILNELNLGYITHSALARKHDIHPVTLYQWKREMDFTKKQKDTDFSEVLNENENLKKENENLKKALAEIAVEKQILQAANDVLKSWDRKKKLKLQKKSLKK